MIPVLTAGEMRAVDEAAPEPVDVLVERAGTAVARVALDVLGGTYGRRVVVVAGKGNNGADGRVAARRLAARGVRVSVLDAAAAPERLPDVDLVIDAAYGIGFRGAYRAPDPGSAFVLAVDVPSGVDATTGAAAAGAVDADLTVTFAALKPGLLLGVGRRRAGTVVVVDVGLDVSGASAHLVEPSDLRLAPRAPDAHKYAAGVAVIGGSPGMTGAPTLAARAAMRAGSGYVRLGIPGRPEPGGPPEAVAVRLPDRDWADAALGACEGMRALAIGPGLGRDDGALRAAAEVIERAPIPVVVDGDGLRSGVGPTAVAQPERVLTPHAGEFAFLAGTPIGDDRLAATRALAARARSTVLSKGDTTIVAAPGGAVRFVTTGSPVLATAGTGDVLTGVVAAFLARGLGGLDAASLAACAHGLAGRRSGRGEGVVASDVADSLPSVLWPAA